MKSARYHLEHMLDCCEDIASFVAGMSAEAFEQDKRSYNAVLMSLTALGEEAAKMRRLFPDWVAAHGEIEWDRIVGMRNLIAHQYFAVDSELVWEVAPTNVPELALRLQRAIVGC